MDTMEQAVQFVMDAASGAAGTGQPVRSRDGDRTDRSSAGG
jgi:hypothetical protein